jgi:hypothetical protein
MQIALDLVRKNILIVVCVCIAILAMVAVGFWPLPGKFDELRTKLDGRKREYEALDALVKKERHLPITDPTETTGKVLEQYPTPLAIKRAGEVAEALTKEGKAVLELAAKYNEHKLLVPVSLPHPTPTLTVQFQDAYQGQMDYVNPEPKVRNETLPYKVLKAAIPPNEQDIQTEAARREEEIRREKNFPGAQAAMEAEIAQMRATLPDELRKDIASKSQMYMNPDAVDVYPGIMVGAAGGAQPTAAQIYFAQVGLWVQQDVFSALAKANEGSTGVVTSAVKHLLKIEVLEEFGKVTTGGTPTAVPTFAGFAGGSGGLPILTNTNITQYTGMGATPGAEGVAVSPRGPTGRTSGPLYDVIPFRLVINVDATQIPKVLTELSRNKFITVTKCEIACREATSEMLLGYYYGQVPVVQLSLECEMLLLKNWLTQYMPPSLAAAPPPPA